MPHFPQCWPTQLSAGVCLIGVYTRETAVVEIVEITNRLFRPAAQWLISSSMGGWTQTWRRLQHAEREGKRDATARHNFHSCFVWNVLKKMADSALPGYSFTTAFVRIIYTFLKWTRVNCHRKVAIRYFFRDGLRWPFASEMSKMTGLDNGIGGHLWSFQYCSTCYLISRFCDTCTYRCLNLQLPLDKVMEWRHDVSWKDMFIIFYKKFIKNWSSS